ncbi:MAG: hypothetical protein IJC56_03205 [Clostridia bacterium]|nr:hypothetical protein [Clostridia bacterium]
MKNNDPIRKSLNENLSAVEVSEYRQRNMIESIIDSGVKVKPVTSRGLIFAAMLLVLSITALGGSVYHARVTPDDMEWGANNTGKMAMQMLNMDGEVINTHANEEQLLHDGFKVGLISGFPVERDFTLMFILNGHIQPYYYNGELCDYSVHTVDAKGSCDIPVSFGELYLTDEEQQFMYAVAVTDVVNNDGSEWVPSDKWDAPPGFSGALTIDFRPESEPNTEIEYVQDYELLPDDWGRASVMWYNKYDTLNEPDRNSERTRIHTAECFYTSNDGTFEHKYAAGGGKVQIVCLVDNIPYVNDNGKLTCLDLKYEVMCLQTANVEGLERGEHKIWMLQVPIDSAYIELAFETPIMFVNVE